MSTKNNESIYGVQFEATYGVESEEFFQKLLYIVENSDSITKNEREEIFKELALLLEKAVKPTVYKNLPDSFRYTKDKHKLVEKKNLCISIIDEIFYGVAINLAQYVKKFSKESILQKMKEELGEEAVITESELVKRCETDRIKYIFGITRNKQVGELIKEDIIREKTAKIREVEAQRLVDEARAKGESLTLEEALLQVSKYDSQEHTRVSDDKDKDGEDDSKSKKEKSEIIETDGAEDTALSKVLDERIAELLLCVVNFPTSILKIIGYLYSDIYFRLDNENASNGCPRLAEEYLRGKTLYDIADQLRDDLESVLRKELPQAFYDRIEDILDIDIDSIDDLSGDFKYVANSIQLDGTEKKLGDVKFTLSVKTITDGVNRINDKVIPALVKLFSYDESDDDDSSDKK